MREHHSGRGRGRGHRFRGGRPRIQPHVDSNLSPTTGETILNLTTVELEVLRLVDSEGLTQEQAAARMHISRGSLWRILQEARTKVISALTAGKTNIILELKE